MSTESEMQGADVGDMAAKGAVVASMTFLSRVSGFVRDVLLSHFLGATDLADAFFVAFRIPNFFRRLFAEGAFNQAFVPVLVRYKSKSATELRLFVAVIGGNLGLVIALVVLVGVVFSEVLVALFAPGFWGAAEQFQLATDMVRITFPYLGFIALTAFAGAVLNTHQRFAVPAFTPVLLNLTLIAAMLIAAATTKNMVFALAWGVFAAGVVQLLFQAPSMARLDLLVAPRLSRSHEGARQVGRLLVPAVLAASVGQVNSLIDTMLASMLITGSISWLYYADRLLELPIGLIAVALGTVLLPNLSRIADSGDARAFAATIDWGLRTGLVLALPASVSLFLLADSLIAAIFYHGVLTALDVSMAALALKAFAVGVVAMVLVKVLAPAFFAHQDTRTPLRYASVSVATNVVLNLSLFWWFGHVGLAFATTIAAWVHFWLLYRGVIERGYYQPGSGVRRSGVASLLAVVVMGIVLASVTPSAGFWVLISTAERVAWLTGLVVAGGVVYLATLAVLGFNLRTLRHHV